MHKANVIAINLFPVKNKLRITQGSSRIFVCKHAIYSWESIIYTYQIPFYMSVNILTAIDYKSLDSKNRFQGCSLHFTIFQKLKIELCTIAVKWFLLVIVQYIL